MSGQFFFTLLNPAVAAILAVTFLVLWRKRSDQAYLAMLALAFLCCGIAFAVNDLLPSFESPASRIASNLMFFVAITSACVGGLMRVNARIPVRLFALTSATMAMTGKARTSNTSSKYSMIRSLSAMSASYRAADACESAKPVILRA